MTTQTRQIAETLIFHSADGDYTTKRLRSTVLMLAFNESEEAKPDNQFIRVMSAIADDEILLAHAKNTAEAQDRQNLSGLDKDLVAFHEMFNTLCTLIDEYPVRKTVNEYYEEKLQPVSEALDLYRDERGYPNGRTLPHDFYVDEGIGQDCVKLIDTAEYVHYKLIDTDFDDAMLLDCVYQQMVTWYYG